MDSQIPPWTDSTLRIDWAKLGEQVRRAAARIAEQAERVSKDRLPASETAKLPPSSADVRDTKPAKRPARPQ
jgi:hypothetical protein